MEAPKEVAFFRDLRGKKPSFRKPITITSCDLEASLRARACIQFLCVQKCGVLPSRC